MIRNSRLSLGVAVACALMAATSARANNLIVNGGFETGDLTGWTTNGGTIVSVQSSFVDLNPNNGSYFAALGDSTLVPALSQTFSDNGGLTTISFSVADSAFSTTSELQVLFDGTLLADLTDPASFGPGGYTTFTLKALATGHDTLTFADTSDFFFALDDVSVAVPEPASMAIFGAGLAGLAALRRRFS